MGNITKLFVKLSSFFWLLKPLAKLYGLVTDGRNWLFDNQLKQSITPAIQTICVGNLTVGGTGKTPMIEFLIERYAVYSPAGTYQTVTLSRGYGRRTHGFRMATSTDTAATIGDEPLQLFRKYGNRVRVTVGERRAGAIQVIEQQYPETRLILLDDAFQHRAVRANITLLLNDYNRPFYADSPFPAGLLRETRQGAARADAVVVTKCPADLSVTDQRLISNEIYRYARPGVPVFFATLRYENPVAFASVPTHQERPDPELKAVVLVSGLANADPLEAYVRQQFTLLNHHRFADHYAYARADLDRIVSTLPNGAAVLTTEKDWVKLDALLTPAERQTWSLYYLPVVMQPLPNCADELNRFLQRATLKKA